MAFYLVLMLLWATNVGCLNLTRESRKAGDVLWSGDPYLEEADKDCDTGYAWWSCVKSRALRGLDAFFRREEWTLSPRLRLVRMPESQLMRLAAEPYQFSSKPRASESDLSKLLKYLYRRTERFIKGSGIVVEMPDSLTEDGRYAPRFIDEIYSEMDILDNKNDKTYKRNQLKKLFIPLLIILKLFKLKLLLFLPLILGLASFKKVIGILLLALPAVVGYFKLCKPDLSQTYGSFGHSSFYHRPPHYYYHQEKNSDPFDRPVSEYAQSQAYRGHTV